MSRHRHRKPVDPTALDSRDARRKALLAKAVEVTGLPETDLRAETLSWLLFTLDLAKTEALHGRLSDTGPWQRLVDALIASCPKPTLLTVNFVDQDLSNNEREELRELRATVAALKGYRPPAATPAEAAQADALGTASAGTGPAQASNVTPLRPDPQPKRDDHFVVPHIDNATSEPTTTPFKSNDVAGIVAEVNAPVSRPTIAPWER